MPLRKLHILIVEDHTSTNDTLARMFRKEGYDVSAAKDGATALKMAEFQRFDLLISDIGLPDTNGWTLLKELRAHQPDLRAIAITGYGYVADLERSVEAGFEKHLTKPSEWPTVKAAVASLFPELAAKSSAEVR
jgi:CheY-like chemotaxis protein